jgi:hypothetical protein
MIPVQNLLFAIDTKANRLSNLRGQFIPNETKIDLLNKAQVKLVLRKIDPNNVYQSGMDSFSKRYEDLQNFQVTYEKLNLTITPGDILNSYFVPFADMANDMMIPITAYVLATNGNCKNRIVDVTDFMKHADIRMFLKSPHYKPSFNYQETLGAIAADKIYVYSDAENSFVPTELYLSYLRYPGRIDIAGYVHLDGTPSTTIDCELESYLEDELVDLVIAELGDATSNQELSQYSRVRIKEDE